MAATMNLMDERFHKCVESEERSEDFNVLIKETCDGVGAHENPAEPPSKGCYTPTLTRIQGVFTIDGAVLYLQTCFSLASGHRARCCGAGSHPLIIIRLQMFEICSGRRTDGLHSL